MLIIIANNDEKGFYIISDTKITYNEDKQPCLIPEPLKSAIKKYGMEKTNIIKRVSYNPTPKNIFENFSIKTTNLDKNK